MLHKIQIKDLDVRNVVEALAETLGADCAVENNEICFDVPSDKGRGYMKAISFSHGVGIIDVDVQLNESIQIEMCRSQVKPLKILFNRESAIQQQFSGKEESHEIRRLESVILSGNTRHYNILTIPANKPVCFFSLEINRKLFETKIEDFLSAMNTELEELFRDVNGINLFFHKGHYSLDIARAIEESIECELLGFTRAVFLEGKAYEILAHHLRLYLDDLSEPDKRKILRQSTVERIEEAAEIIKKELENLGTILSLSKRVGLNQNTLQTGFKHLYGSSVNQYIRNAKIEKAKELIETSDLNITEITYLIGINSRSYFSKLFKERYVMSPSEYMAKVRNSQDTSPKTA
ncbi:helix-turn-helix transcriptional regulator [Flavobacteriaceae bacterium TP-CH-4]|uniref:Helix-turn-helix transcriptional regulator n=1 Tax=Pelagihabitans pacificus TaxID=2696054 RepID=A0A967AX96_9FLAO|nr:AraC family transcriptional regulator [Pelagihabitans pacificus]NHF61025.1 helix-turn-helix transcriptional regulator [Pelagihabitans pacificus]